MTEVRCARRMHATIAGPPGMRWWRLRCSLCSARAGAPVYHAFDATTGAQLVD